MNNTNLHKIKTKLSIALLIISSVAYGQKTKSVSISFVPQFQGKVLEMDTVLDNTNTSITKLMFYISQIEFTNSENEIWKEKNSYHLINYDDKESINLTAQLPLNFDPIQVNFALGIDSTTNVSGVMAGDLDPMHGMYWTWQSGYINFKLEGKSDRSKSRKNKFQYHLGGYLPPFESFQSISLPINNPSEIMITIDIGELISDIDMTTNSQIMSPRMEAVELSKKLAKLFQI